MLWEVNEDATHGLRLVCIFIHTEGPSWDRNDNYDLTTQNTNGGAKRTRGAFSGTLNLGIAPIGRTKGESGISTETRNYPRDIMV